MTKRAPETGGTVWIVSGRTPSGRFALLIAIVVFAAVSVAGMLGSMPLSTLFASVAVGLTLATVTVNCADPEPLSLSVTVTVTVKLPLSAYVCDCDPSDP